MLKFDTNDTTVLSTFEDFILIVCVIIDDLYHCYAPPEIANRRNILDAKLTDPKIITISLCGELAGIDSENAWYSFVKKNYKHLFPNLCNRSRPSPDDRAASAETLLHIHDAVQQVLHRGQLPACCLQIWKIPVLPSFRGYGADYGKCPSKKETYFGYKVHVMVTLEGYITAFEGTPASVDDREGLRDLMDGQSNLAVLGDKSYVSDTLAKDMLGQGICLMALKRSNSRQDWPRPMRQLIFKLRRLVETIFSQLSGQLNAEQVLAKSFQGLCTRLANKILAYNLCIVLNRIFHETCKLGQIKQLVF